jgi:hypothetical protein
MVRVIAQALAGLPAAVPDRRPSQDRDALFPQNPALEYLV